MTLLWDNDPAAADRYNYAVGGDILRMDSSVALVRALEESPRENLVIIGPDVDMQIACDLSESVRVLRAEVGVLLLRRRLDVAVLGQALRAGVREVITADDLTGLADAVMAPVRMASLSIVPEEMAFVATYTSVGCCAAIAR